MRFIVAVAINFASLIGPAICQTSTPPVPASIAEQIRIDSFQLQKRTDGYGIAGFVISNNSDQALKSVELTCWVNGDRARGTKVLIWPNSQSILAHDRQQFSNVNIGSVGEGSRAECEVTGVD
jgi:hypothetical protein